MIGYEIAKSIVRRAMMAAQGEVLKQKMEDLVQASKVLYRSSFKPGEYAIMQSLPSNWMHLESSKSYRIRGEWHTLRFANGYGFSVDWAYPMPTVGSLERMPSRVDDQVFQIWTPEIATFLDAEAAFDEFRSTTEAVFEKTVQTVRSLTSLKALHADWPELAVYAPSPTIRSKSRALINTAAINAELGIPVPA